MQIKADRISHIWSVWLLKFILRWRLWLSAWSMVFGIQLLWWVTGTQLWVICHFFGMWRVAYL